MAEMRAGWMGRSADAEAEISEVGLRETGGFAKFYFSFYTFAEMEGEVMRGYRSIHFDC
jgi:hypothetical protein